MGEGRIMIHKRPSGKVTHNWCRILSLDYVWREAAREISGDTEDHEDSVKSISGAEHRLPSVGILNQACTEHTSNGGWYCALFPSPSWHLTSVLMKIVVSKQKLNWHKLGNSRGWSGGCIPWIWQSQGRNLCRVLLVGKVLGLMIYL